MPGENKIEQLKAKARHRGRGFTTDRKNAGCSSTKQSRHFYGLNNGEANKGIAKGRRAEQGEKELPSAFLG